MNIEIIEVDPNSEEGKKMSEEMDNHIDEIKIRIATAGYKSYEGFYFDEEGEPKSIDPETD